MIPQEVLKLCADWVLENTQGAVFVDWKALEGALCRHLIDSGVFALELPCGCCDLVGIQLKIYRVQQDHVVDFEGVKRPSRRLLH